jgi:outer membrane biosynthesis protein TonB
MMTEPLAPAAPLTKEERDRLAKTYHTGDDQQGQVEAQRGPDRAARSKHVARLTEEEYAKIAKAFHTGNDQQGMVEAMIGPLRAARSERSRPLTKEEYAAQTKIYWTGLDNGNTTPAEREAGLRGALSFQASLVSPTAQIDYSNRFHAPDNDRMALAVAQPPPELPAGLSLAKPVVVVARFQIAEDGSFEVTLVTSATEPRLNDALLAAFQHWRFEPAYRSGHPAASSVDYHLTIAPSLAVRVVSKVKLLETENQAEFERRGAPATPIETPPPDLPPALLRPGAEWSTVLRVHVARDGTAAATVITPAADPAITSAVQAVLRRWRFRPTFIRGSQPQDSTIELSLTVSVSE